MDLAAWAADEAERRLSPLDSRWAHTQGVAARARALLGTVPVADREMLIAAAYLHDIGYALELRGSGFHPLDGARWLRQCGHDRLACLVAHHSGARFEAKARGLAYALAEFPQDDSATADVLTYCDLTTDPEGLEVTPSVRLAEIESRYGGDSDVARGMNAGERALAALIARTEQRITLIGATV
jgi:putative nucleotidyltransferase with HDIG domain